MQLILPSSVIVGSFAMRRDRFGRQYATAGGPRHRGIHLADMEKRRRPDADFQSGRPREGA
jgi:hypothetical protein